MIERFERHACGHRPVADQSDHHAVFAAMKPGPGHAERRRDRGTGVARTKMIVL